MLTTELPDWDEIVDRHARRVLRVSLRILGSLQDAEDVSQEVFAEAFRLHQSGPVQSWAGLLVRLATLRSIDRLRSKRVGAEFRDIDRMHTVEPFQEAAAAELAQWLRQAMARLPDQQASVFAMYHFERLSREDVATALGISPAAVSTALHKARTRLLQQLAVFNRGEVK